MYRTLLVVGLLMATQAGMAQSRKKLLDDATLDRVTAAGVTARVSPGGVVNFSGAVPTANGPEGLGNTGTGNAQAATAPVVISPIQATVPVSASHQRAHPACPVEDGILAVDVEVDVRRGVGHSLASLLRGPDEPGASESLQNSRSHLPRARARRRVDPHGRASGVSRGCALRPRPRRALRR